MYIAEHTKNTFQKKDGKHREVKYMLLTTKNHNNGEIGFIQIHIKDNEGKESDYYFSGNRKLFYQMYTLFTDLGNNDIKIMWAVENNK